MAPKIGSAPAKKPAPKPTPPPPPPPPPTPGKKPTGGKKSVASSPGHSGASVFERRAAPAKASPARDPAPAKAHVPAAATQGKPPPAPAGEAGRVQFSAGGVPAQATVGVRGPGIVEALGAPVQEAFAAAGDALSQVGNAVGRGVQTVTDGIGQALEAGGNLVDRGVQAVTGGLNRLGEAGRDLLETGADLVSRGLAADQQTRREVSRDDFLDPLVQGSRAIRDAVFGPYSPKDGLIVGNGGQSYAPDTPLSQVTPTPSVPRTQADGSAPPTVIYVNGILTDRAGHEGNINALAQAGHNVIGIHNETYGTGWDVLEAARNKLGGTDTPAVQTLSNAILTEVRAGRDIHLVGHSQGGEITAQSLYEARQELIEEGRSPEEVEALFREHVDVETYGSAGIRYPDGPEYVHYINEEDPIANTVGIGIGNHLPGSLGEDAVVRVIPRDQPGFNEDAHHLNTYLPYHVPFEEARETFPRAD